jgi:hypothetical protein
MSNYLFAMGEKRELEIIHQYFSNIDDDNDSELTFKRNKNGLWTLIIENRVSHLSSSIVTVGNNTGKDESIFFKGFCQDHDSKVMILGAIGFRDYYDKHITQPLSSGPIDLEGSFVLAAWGKNKLTIQNDLYSLFPVIYFSTSTIVVASDSMYLISKIRRLLGMPCKVNRRVAIAKAWTHGFASAPLSNNTIIEGVNLLSPGKYLSVNLRRSSYLRKILFKNREIISALAVDRDIRSLFPPSSISYSDALVSSTIMLYSSLYSIVNSGHISLQLGLSGGLDSRVILAIALESPEILAALDIKTNTHPSRKADFDIVKSLSEKFGFVFNQENSRTKNIASPEMALVENISVENPFGFWVLSDLGYYDEMYFRANYWSNPSVIEVGGHGAEIIRSVFGGKTLSEWISNRSKQITNNVILRTSVIAEMTIAMEKMGISPEESDSVKWHGLAFKQRIHCSRFIPRSCLGLRPYLQRAFFTLSLSECNPYLSDSNQPGSMLHDIIILLNPELAAHSFDEEHKNLTEEYISERKKHLGTMISFDEINKYDTYGQLTDIANGPPSSFMATVNSFNCVGLSNKQAVLNAVEESWAVLKHDDEMFELYNPIYENVKQLLNDPSTYLPEAGVEAAKIIMMSMVDL